MSFQVPDPGRIKAVGTDLDGTLLPASKNISPCLGEIINKLEKRGIIFFPVTGKTLSLTEQTFADLKIQDLPMVCLDGAVIRLNGQVLWNPETFLRSEMVSEIMALTESISLFMFDRDVLYIRGTVKEDIHKPWAPSYGADPECAGLSSVTHLILVHKNRSYLENTAEKIKPVLGSEARSYISLFHGYFNLLVCSKNLSKSEGAQTLLKHYGLTLQDMLFFGDWKNDITLLKKAGFPVAMKNSVPGVAAHSHSVTLFTNEEKGVEKFLVNFFGLE